MLPRRRGVSWAGAVSIFSEWTSLQVVRQKRSGCKPRPRSFTRMSPASATWDRHRVADVTLGLSGPGRARDDVGASFRFSCQTASGHAFALSRRDAMRPSFASMATPFKEREGAGKAGCTLHPRSRVHQRTKKRTRAYRSSGGIPAFPARWVTAYFALSPVTGFLATVIPEKLVSQELDASIGAPGPHGFTVREACVRRPPHPTARSWRSRAAPLIG
jgi:hypothetical protein